MIDCIFLPPTAGAVLTPELPVWHVAPGGPGRAMTLADVARELGTTAVAVVIPVEQVTALTVTAPARRARWRGQALAYAAEPWLTGDVEALHVVAGERLADGRQRVMAMARVRLTEWLAQLDDLGIPVAAVHVDADLLPRGRGTCLWVGAERCLLGGDGVPRMSWLLAAWPALREQVATPLVAMGTTAVSPLPDPMTWHQVTDLHAMLAAQQSHGIDLGVGLLKRRRHGHAHPRNLRWLAAVVLVGILLQCAWQQGAAWVAESAAARYHAAGVAAYQQLFAHPVRGGDLSAQWQRQLRALDGAPSRFDSLLGTLSLATAHKTSARVTRLRWTAKTHTLRAVIEVADPAAAMRLRQRIAAAGVSVTGPAASGAKPVQVEWTLERRS